MYRELLLVNHLRGKFHFSYQLLLTNYIWQVLYITLNLNDVYNLMFLFTSTRPLLLLILIERSEKRYLNKTHSTLGKE